MSYKDFQNELYATGNKLWLKLQRLPKAEPVEIVCFFVIILFIGRAYLAEFREGNYTQLQGLETMSAATQTATQVLEDLKTRILTNDWALGGLVVLASFLTVIIALLLFALIFGYCSTPRNKGSI
ncbi:small integral membrane protein 5 isoform X1 [Sceloporus undulatus]|uniref:small integral membrane protein 5 isoform X1 n=1 Tax=Sceloporus undulatus TaxID=8520 RepID=UPI001C4D24DD|nr:small integral membrane protein 5 isoform X1 [Sceloporus undulatus]XP_042307009.1 small integral membrane protein 5 isoform X1 [Sceloporus undulatus]